jgi:hypothetical protein
MSGSGAPWHRLVLALIAQPAQFEDAAAILRGSTPRKGRG